METPSKFRAGPSSDGFELTGSGQEIVRRPLPQDDPDSVAKH